MKYSLNSLKKKAHHMKILSSCKGQQGETQQLSHTFHFHPRDDEPQESVKDRHLHP